MTEKKDTAPVKLTPTAKEFIPKDKKLLNKAETREGRSGSVSLNPAAKEFVPKPSPVMAPAPIAVLAIPPEMNLSEGSSCSYH